MQIQPPHTIYLAVGQHLTIGAKAWAAGQLPTEGLEVFQQCLGCTPRPDKQPAVGNGGDLPAVGGHRRPVMAASPQGGSGERRLPARLAIGQPNAQQLIAPFPEAIGKGCQGRKQQALALGIPTGSAGAGQRRFQQSRPAIQSAHIDVAAAPQAEPAGAQIGQLIATGRDAGQVGWTFAVRQLASSARLQIQLPDLHAAAAVAGEHQAVAVGREYRIDIQEWVLGQAPRCAAALSEPQVPQGGECKCLAVRRHAGTADAEQRLRVAAIEIPDPSVVFGSVHGNGSEQRYGLTFLGVDAASPQAAVRGIHQFRDRQPGRAKAEYVFVLGQRLGHRVGAQQQELERRPAGAMLNVGNHRAARAPAGCPQAVAGRDQGTGRAILQQFQRPAWPPAVYKNDAGPIRSIAGKRRFAGAAGKLAELVRVQIQCPDAVVAAAIRCKHDPGTVGRHVGFPVIEGTAGERSAFARRQAELPDVPLTAGIALIDHMFAIRREARIACLMLRGRQWLGAAAAHG